MSRLSRWVSGAAIVALGVSATALMHPTYGPANRLALFHLLSGPQSEAEKKEEVRQTQIRELQETALRMANDAGEAVYAQERVAAGLPLRPPSKTTTKTVWHAIVSYENGKIIVDYSHGLMDGHHSVTFKTSSGVAVASVRPNPNGGLFIVDDPGDNVDAIVASDAYFGMVRPDTIPLSTGPMSYRHE